MKQSGADFSFSSAPLSKVRSVEFGLMSQEQIRQWTGNIVLTEITTNNLDGTPIDGGLNDLRMGVNTNFQKCRTCGETKYCQGHFGRIELEKAVYHVGFIPTCVKVLQTICIKCGRLRQTRNEEMKAHLEKAYRVKLNRRRLNEIVKVLKKAKECSKEKGDDYCGEKIPCRIQALQGKIFYRFEKTSADRELTAEQCMTLFSRIRLDEAKQLGFTRDSMPKDLIIKSLLVCPPQVRPAIEMNPARVAQDQYTKIYKKIIQRNNEIKACKSAQEQDRLLPELLKEVAKLIDSDKAGKIKQKGSQPLKSIRARLKGKEGRFRQNLMGKRVDFCARSVISPDANLAMDELGVPQSIAEQLTIPEEVTQYNIDRMIQLAKSNKIKFIIVPTTDPKTRQKRFQALTFDFTDTEEEIRQKINQGVIVERCLQDGDFVLFNRQPTLHRMSMMGHRVRILPYSTFRLNLSVCTPYNADFDGDEMNMHVPQSYETIAEIKYLTHVPRQIVTPKNNQPVMGIVQDSLLGCCLFTQRDTFLTREQVMNLMMWNEGFDGELPMPAVLRPQELWTGKQIMSMIIPQSINTERGIKDEDLRKPDWNADDRSLCIQKGTLVSGIFNKELVGQGAGSVVHLCWLDLGAEKTLEFMTSCQRIVNNWLQQHGFTVGCQDIAPHPRLVAETEKRSSEQDDEYIKLVDIFLDPRRIEENRYHQKGKRLMDSFEYTFNMKLNKVRDDIQSKVSETIDQIRNCMYKMIWAKSKGDSSNIAQITSLVGQQNLESKRIQYGFSYRTLPHFPKFDSGPEARGFVGSNFFKGLSPAEFFFHTMGGRDGLIDTAVKTSRTGYIQRKLIKAVEDVFVKYDWSCRDSVGCIYQFQYGEDCMAAEFIEHQEIKCVALSDQQMVDRYCIISDIWHQDEISIKYANIFTQDVILRLETNLEGQSLLRQEYIDILKTRDQLRSLFLDPSALKEENFTHYYLPVNIERIISTIKINKKVSEREQCRLNPIDVVRQVDQLLKDVTKLTHINDNVGYINLFTAHLRVALASKEVCVRHRLTPETFKEGLDEILYKLKKSLSHPGEAVGAIAAQSMGEPTTQMTLNTFHKSGVTGDKNVTLGVPRLSELLDASKKAKTPSLTIYFDPPLEYAELEMKDDKDRTKYNERNIVENLKTQNSYDDFSNTQLVQMQGRILFQSFGQFIIRSEIYYQGDPENYPIRVSDEIEDEDIQDDLFQIGEEKKEQYKWILLLRMDRQKIIANLEIWDRIRDAIPKVLDVSERLFGVSSKNTQIDFDNMSNKYILIQYRWDEASQKKFKPERNRLYMDDEVELDDQNKNISYVATPFSQLKRLENLVREFTLSGIPRITKILHTQIEKPYLINKQTGGFLRQTNLYGKGRWRIIEKTLETEGTNLKEVLKLDNIDTRRTITDDVYEIQQILGIEAARQALINETRKIFNHYGIYINYRHLYLLYDWMTHRGRLTAINRNGINRIPELSILRKASFEETVEILYDAAIFSEVDPMKGLSENIIFGQLCPHGTGSFQVMVDPNKVKDFKIKCSHTDIYDQPPEYIEQDFSPNVHQTPIGINTPAPGAHTPGPYTPQTVLGQLTPNSPREYTPDIAIRPSPGYHQSPYPMRSVHSPLYTQPHEPLMEANYEPSPGQSPRQSGSQNSPSYSPTNSQRSMVHSPHSPHYPYQSSPSPSYRSSGERGQQRSSSPATNSLHRQSPQYNQSSYNSPVSQHSSGNAGYNTGSRGSGSPNSPANLNTGSNFQTGTNTFSPAYMASSRREDQRQEYEEEEQ